MRRTLFFIGFCLFALLLLALLCKTGIDNAQRAEAGLLQAKRQLVKKLGLTDLALWSEARYTRHPSQADLFTAFQDYPAAFDHFPAGSIISPGLPPHASSLQFRRQGQN